MANLYSFLAKCSFALLTDLNVLSSGAEGRNAADNLDILVPETMLSLGLFCVLQEEEGDDELFEFFVVH
jgi:hypothetical protein